MFSDTKTYDASDVAFQDAQYKKYCVAVDPYIGEIRAKIGNTTLQTASTATKIKSLREAADLAYKYAAPLAPCKKGCNLCCHMNVVVTRQEAETIGQKIGIKPRKIERSVLHPTGKFSSKTPCPFLVNDECSIYEHRPFECRKYWVFSRDNRICDPDTTYTMISHGIANEITMASYRLFSIGKELPITADIRDFFPKGRSQ